MFRCYVGSYSECMLPMSIGEYRCEEPGGECDFKWFGFDTGKQEKYWVVVVVSFFFNVHTYVGKWSNLTTVYNMFQMGWNHQLESNSSQ